MPPPTSVNHQLICFAFGQVIMLLNVNTGVFSKYLTNNGVSLPTLQSAFLYAALGLVYLPIKFFVRRQTNLAVPIWFYALIAFVDVEANYFAVKAFNYANYVTVGLLLNLTVPFATLFCYIFLKTRYAKTHYLASFIAVCGSVVIFVTDYNSSINGEMSREIRGNIYCVIAAAMYAASNVMIQSVVKVRDFDTNIELLGFLGLFAAIISAVQISILELDPIKEAQFSGKIYGYFAGFVLSMFTFYTLVSVFLRWAESLMFNLSLLTGPVFTVFASYFLFDESVKSWYWLALGLFYIGLTIYAFAPAPVEAHQAAAAENHEHLEKDYDELWTPDDKSPAAMDKA
ncbi:hypothetical protein ATCC90586_002815 [Pythium insidiosum]|nr:hypothetical protein ATCC90586_002815 [Pythium insidiosum]